MSWSGVITNAGQTMLATYASGGHTLTIDAARVGSGTVSEANMRSATALVSQKDTAAIVKSTAASGAVQIKLQVGPHASSAYTAKEIGIWGHIDSESSTLMALHQDTTGVSVPTRAQNPDFVFNLNAVISVSNTDDLSVTVDPSAYVSGTTLDETLTSYPVATSSAKGMMSAADKAKLDGVATGANNYSHPGYTAQTGVPTGNQTPGFGGSFNVGQVATNSLGHVTGITNRTVTIPSTAASSSGAGLMSAADKAKLDGVATGANNYSHPGYTAQTGVPTGNQTPGFGGNFNVGQVTSDATGHVTGITNRTVTIPSTPASSSGAGLMSAADKAKLDGVATGANNYSHPGYTAQTGKPASNVAVTLGSAFTVSQVASDATGHVSAMTDRTVTVNHPAYTAQTGVPTANQAPGFGGSFNVGQVTSDAMGHVTGVTSRSVTIPSATATTSSSGLMSAADKVAVNNALVAKDRPSGVTTLDEYLTMGIYAVSKNSVTNGWPTEAAGTGSNSYAVLEVLKTTGSYPYYMQRLTYNINGNFQMFVRTKYNTAAWQDWKEVSFIRYA